MLYFLDCGSHSTLDVQQARITGGSNAATSQWPSVALLFDRKQTVKCTASILTPKWAIASHSCVGGRPIVGDWVLYAGGTQFFDTDENGTFQMSNVKEIVPHPQAKYAQFEYINDAVLIELETPLDVGRNVSVICLPDASIERQLCVTAGWGVSKPGGNYFRF